MKLIEELIASRFCSFAMTSLCFKRNLAGNPHPLWPDEHDEEVDCDEEEKNSDRSPNDPDTYVHVLTQLPPSLPLGFYP